MRVIAHGDASANIVNGMREPIIAAFSGRGSAKALAALVGIGALGLATSALALRGRLRSGGA